MKQLITIDEKGITYDNVQVKQMSFTICNKAHVRRDTEEGDDAVFLMGLKMNRALWVAAA